MNYKTRTPQEWLNSIKINPWKLSIIPKNMITTEILRECVQLDGEILEIIHGRNLEYMVQNDIYELAVQNIGASIEFVPEDCITERMCHNTIFGAKGKGSNIKFIPKILRNPEICNEAVIQNIRNIIHIPDEYITESMYIFAIEENFEILNTISLENISEDIAKMAIEKGFPVKKLPKRFHTKEFFKLSLDNSVDIIDIKDVPKDILTYEICKKALEKAGDAIEYIPKEFIDIKMLEILLSHNGEIKFTKK
jgi:hypothetical protein